jgi:hypothetical protein
LVLAAAINIYRNQYRILFDRTLSLEYAELLQRSFPLLPDGYLAAAEDLLYFRKPEQAKCVLREYLFLKDNEQVSQMLFKAQLKTRSRNQVATAAEVLVSKYPNSPESWETIFSGLLEHSLIDEIDALMRGAPIGIQKSQSYQDMTLAIRLAKQARNDLLNDGIKNILDEFLNGRRAPVPIGDLCFTAEILRQSLSRTEALPFDWLYLGYEGPSIIRSIVEDNFASFLDESRLKSYFLWRRCGHDNYHPSLFFKHHDPTREPDRSAFVRRIRRFRSIIQSKRDQYFFFNIRLTSRFDDLEALAESVGDNVRVVSIVLRGGKSHRAPLIKYSSDSVMQIEFICNNVDTPFARKQPEGFTDGINIHCPYVQFYITNLIRHCSETADSGPQDY